MKFRHPVNHLLVEPMLYVTKETELEHVPVCRITLVTLTMVVAQNVQAIQIAQQIELVLETNVKTLVPELVD